MVTGALPWGALADRAAVARAKAEDGALERACAGLPPQIPAIGRVLAQYARDDRPDYVLIASFVVAAMRAARCRFRDRFDWEGRLDRAAEQRISVIPLAIPPGERPTVPTPIVPAVVPGEEEPRGCCAR
jgi:hypothetical protein